MKKEDVKHDINKNAIKEGTYNLVKRCASRLWISIFLFPEIELHEFLLLLGLSLLPLQSIWSLAHKMRK